MNFLKSTWEKLKESVAKMSKTARILAGAAIGVTLVVAIVMTIVLNRVEYADLYPDGELTQGDAGTIHALLLEQGTNVKIEGTKIYVPAEEVDTIRISLAAQGYPQEGLDYSTYNSDSAFGMTDSEEQYRRQLQYQESLRVMVNRFEKVKDSIVIVNMATKSSYVSSSNNTPASASVTLQLENGAELTNAEARAMAEMVMKSVPMLAIENVSIVDSTMKQYDISDEALEMDEMDLTQHQQILAENMKQVLSEQVLRILKPVMGNGNVAVSVNLSLDFDEETISSVEFAPPVDGMEEGLVRSSEVLRDSIWELNEEGGAVGTDSNGVGGTEYVYDEDDLNKLSESISEIYNYELNEVKTLIEKAKGSITGLSVAVVINSKVEGAEDAVESMEDLVANAVGVDKEYVSVAALPFLEDAGNAFEQAIQANKDMLDALNRSELIKTLCICGALILIVAMVLIFLRKVVFPKPEKVEESEEMLGTHVDITVGEDGEVELTEEERRAKLIEGLRKKSEGVQKVEDLMNADMDAVVQIIRNWLAE
ncbi:MAG: flagellar M-ring protein FliF [Oscillospiraceae bacterium]|nr:flagellar M-ring protein FliF [Oscillospiraceae bacterium]